jgi:hypothetical protein
MKFRTAHGGASAVTTDVEHGNGGGGRIQSAGEFGEGFAQVGGHFSHESPEITGVKFQSGVGTQILGSFLIGTCPARGPAEESGDGGSEASAQSKKIVQRAATGAAFGVVVVVAP